jgi:hypothetical protein
LDGTDEKNRDDRAASLEKYLGMKEHEKDAEIHNAVIRLQKRIQEILYTLESEQQDTRTFRQETRTEPKD